MDTQTTLPEPAKKPKNLKWLWILLGIIGLACLALIAVVVIIANLSNNQVIIDAGTYDGTVYTASDDHFSCDFKDIMTKDFNPSIDANESIKNGTGYVEAWNELGQNYGVDYFNMSEWGGEEMAILLSSPDTREKALQSFFNNTVLQRSPNATITYQEFLPTGELFVALDNPEGSRKLTVETNGVTKQADTQEGYYIVAQKDWLYLVHFFTVPVFDTTRLSPSDIQSKANNFYQNCQFQI